MSKVGMTMFWSAWLTLVSPRSSRTMERRYLPSYLGPRATLLTRPRRPPLHDAHETQQSDQIILHVRHGCKLKQTNVILSHLLAGKILGLCFR